MADADGSAQAYHTRQWYIPDDRARRCLTPARYSPPSIPGRDELRKLLDDGDAIGDDRRVRRGDDRRLFVEIDRGDEDGVLDAPQERRRPGGPRDDAHGGGGTTSRRRRRSGPEVPIRSWQPDGSPRNPRPIRPGRPPRSALHPRRLPAPFPATTRRRQSARSPAEGAATSSMSSKGVAMGSLVTSSSDTPMRWSAAAGLVSSFQATGVHGHAPWRRGKLEASDDMTRVDGLTADEAVLCRLDPEHVCERGPAGAKGEARGQLRPHVPGGEQEELAFPAARYRCKVPDDDVGAALRDPDEADIAGRRQVDKPLPDLSLRGRRRRSPRWQPRRSSGPRAERRRGSSPAARRCPASHR